MSFMLFLRGLIGVLIVFAIATYAMTHSLWTTFINTVICALIIQVGYFAAVLFTIWRSGTSGREKEPGARADISPAGDAKPEGKAAPLPGVGRTPLT